MSSLLITNIKFLVNTREQNELLRGRELMKLPCIEHSFLLIEDGQIANYGSMEKLKSISHKPTSTLDVPGQFALPAWCDSHTHLVFAGSRENEFVDKIRGLSYAEIAAKGGGILNSAKRLNDTSEEELFNMAWKRLTEIS